ncbi:MAG: molybdenum cofactor guanylyltransferase [Candidatus Binatia bacterium]|jgi:molybdenum cofactor guanylyltransferase
MTRPRDLQPKWISDTVASVILAGGQNSRMGGADKAFLTVNGQTVFQRTLGLLQRCFPQVVVVSNRPEKYAQFDVEVTRDEFPGRGPLAGIHAGLGLVRCPYAFVVACDMPFLRVEPIAHLVNRIQGQEAIVPCWDGDIEPLHAVYATALRGRMERVLSASSHSIREFLPTIGVEYIPEAVMCRVKGAEESFRNVNTPEEAARFAVHVHS